MRKILALSTLLIFLTGTAQAQISSRVAARFQEFTFAGKPAAPAAGIRITITDCLTTACATGGGTIRADLRWTGSAYEVIAAVGGAGLPLSGGTLTGNLLFTDNLYDIGASGATRPRTGYFGTSLITPFISVGTSPADAGDIRLPNAGTIQWEAAPAGTNCSLMVNSSEQFAPDCPLLLSTNFIFGGVTLTGVGGTGPTLINGTLTSPINLDVLQYNGTNWVNAYVGLDTNPQAGAIYAIVTGDKDKLVLRTHTTTMADTIVQAGTAGFPDQWTTRIRNDDTVDAYSLTATTSAICTDASCGSSVLNLAPGDEVRLTSNGTNYIAQVYRGLASPVTVAQGGTGAATFTANGVLFGNGTSPIGATAVGTAGQCLTSNGVGVAPTYQACGAGGGANTALSNLAAVAINTSLLPGAAGTVHLGSATLPFGEIFFAGTSGTPGTNNFKFTGASTSGLRTITLPDAGGSVALGPAAGFVTFTGPTVARSYALPDAAATILTNNAAVTIAQGGTGTASTLVGLVRGSASAMTAAELSGDVTTSGSNVVTLISTALKDSSTHTLTNKTLDVEATGNSITTVHYIGYEGTCQNTTASFSLDTPTANAPAAACVTGTNIVNRGVLDFDAATDETVYGSFLLPSDWAGAIDLNVEASATEAGTNVARLSISGICVADGETFDPAFNTAQTFAWTNTGSGQRVTAVQAGLTTTGCAAGERYYFKFFRDADGTSGTDSLGVDLRVIAIRFKYRRGQ